MFGGQRRTKMDTPRLTEPIAQEMSPFNDNDQTLTELQVVPVSADYFTNLKSQKSKRMISKVGSDMVSADTFASSHCGTILPETTNSDVRNSHM